MMNSVTLVIRMFIAMANTNMDGAPSVAVELLSQKIDDLTQVICTEQIISSDLRTDFSELQERFNSSFSLQGTSPIRPMGESSRMAGEVKARERKIVRKGINRLERQIKQYIH